MFTSLNLKPVFLQKGGLTLWRRTVTEQRLRLVIHKCWEQIKAGGGKVWNPQTQVKGWKKCNVYCCTIFSNKRTQNLFVIFLCEHSLKRFFLFHFFVMGQGGSCNFSTCIPFIISPFIFLFFLPSFLPHWFQPLYLHHRPVFCLTLCLSPSVRLSLWLLYRSNMDTNLGEDFLFPQMWTNPRRSLTAKRCCSWANKHFTVFVTIL